ncbi:hypothetical protein RRG08_017641 [Elysia crispata]|uniref:Uncharacterized protein n=1 Tax=Elysia crispata TaxID=231223 RepID=A0AAE1DD09_9GAST|nr:hypothetical protein RRG08_017641 [Elysia crispata]
MKSPSNWFLGSLEGFCEIKPTLHQVMFSSRLDLCDSDVKVALTKLVIQLQRVSRDRADNPNTKDGKVLSNQQVCGDTSGLSGGAVGNRIVVIDWYIIFPIFVSIPFTAPSFLESTSALE